MAATVEISESNTVSETVTNGITNVNFGSADAPNLNNVANPIVAGGNSYEKWLRFHLIALAGSNQVDNFKVWISDLGLGLKQGESFKTSLKSQQYVAPSFQTPVNTVSVVAVEDMPLSEPTIGNNVGIGGSLMGTIDSDDQYSDYFVIQLQTTAQTPSGNLNQKVITFQYDEQ